MNFEEVIEKLYSLDDELICDVLNNGLHVSQCVDADNAVCTGFQCKTHKGTIFDVRYLISQQRVCYMKWLSPDRRPVIGAPCLFDPKKRLVSSIECYNSGFDIRKDVRWYTSYDIETKQFNQAIAEVKDVTKDEDKHIANVILDNDVTVSSFQVFRNQSEIKSYPLISKYVPVLYKSDKFSPYSLSRESTFYREITDTSWDNYGRSCEKYNGYNGWSDDLIDDVYGGIPEATWNVD